MGFLGVCRAVYDYVPQAEGELAITQGDFLFILDNTGDDGWWKAKKKASVDDEDEPTGLIPNNYVEDAPSISEAQALYEYTRQTDEELSFPEDAKLQVYDTSDPDWILVGFENEFGFAPSNYIELSASGASPAAAPVPPALPSRTQPDPPAIDPQPNHVAAAPEPEVPAATSAAAAIASAMQARKVIEPPVATSTPPPQLPARHVAFSHTVDDIEDEPQSPPLPSRPTPSKVNLREPPSFPTSSPSMASPLSPVSINDDTAMSGNRDNKSSVVKVEGGYHLYNVNEMVSVMGKRKKMPTTLGINLLTGIIMIAPEKSTDGPTQEWTADKMTHYSREGKHIFLEMVRPTKSVDFHAGAKDTAEEIVSALGEMAGAMKANGLREVIMAATSNSQKLGVVLYDFMAQGDDEVTVAEGDEVIIMDDHKSADWWHVRRLRNNMEGVVPSSYIEITGTMTPPESHSGLNAGRSIAAQNRAEEIRLTKEAVKASKRADEQQVGLGISLPQRSSSLNASEHDNNLWVQQNNRHSENGHRNGAHDSGKKSKPDASRVRTWTDRSKSFTVEAQFIGIKDGKLNLHKLNGVKIAVPIVKMSVEDLEYVESITGLNLVPSGTRAAAKTARQQSTSSTSGAVVQKQKPEHDWFQFFLDCDIAVGLCERYSQAFVKDSMDESVLPDVTSSVLRNIGMREGDIIKVMRKLDAKYNRTSKPETAADGDPNDQGGLFTTSGGALRTKRSRPAPPNVANGKVDLDAFSKSGENGSISPATSSKSPAGGGFDDDAWAVRDQPAATATTPTPTGATTTTTETVTTAAPAAPSTASAPAPGLVGSIKELSLLAAPLEPTKAPTPEISAPGVSSTTGAIQPQATGATPSFFTTMQQNSVTGVSGSLVPPPTSRPLSAPQTAGLSAFPSPAPVLSHMTGVQGQVAPLGQSLNDIQQARLQQQYLQQMQQQQMQQQQLLQAQMKPMGVPGQTPMLSFPTGMQNPVFMQPAVTGMAAMPQQMPMQTGFAAMQPQMTSMQSQSSPFQSNPGFNIPPQQGPFLTARPGLLPTPLEPQRTGLQPSTQQQNPGPGLQVPGPVAAPLAPQPTGPAPPVRFGVTAAQKLTPQPTGRKANLSHATPDNPFGF
ncbi:SH3 domain-containing protein [Ceratocystis lukuohia]|uniref:Actin cytoskeleton-regulatory complex protein SLA1 n=1 Tax=Ceratocystis lukuohia TaxID=2019550 RepID=A0ABR4MGJ0_9PEZI